eukprot:Gb_19169 [translate_table: standard]
MALKLAISSLCCVMAAAIMAAIQCLKRKKLYETQVEQLGNFQLRIHDQMIMLEGAKATTETVDALRSGASAMKTIQKAILSPPDDGGPCPLPFDCRGICPPPLDYNGICPPSHWVLLLLWITDDNAEFEMNTRINHTLHRGCPETTSTSQPCLNGFLHNFPLPVTFEFPCTSECGTFSCLSKGSSPMLSSTLQPPVVSLQDHACLLPLWTRFKHQTNTSAAPTTCSGFETLLILQSSNPRTAPERGFDTTCENRITDDNAEFKINTRINHTLHSSMLMPQLKEETPRKHYVLVERSCILYAFHPTHHLMYIHLTFCCSPWVLEVTRDQSAYTFQRSEQKWNIDDIDKTMDEVNEHTENMKQIQEALAAPIGAAADIDEDELEAELEELEGAELEEQLLQPATTAPASQLPAVPALQRPAQVSPQKAAPQNTTEDDELAALQAEMAL